MQQPDKTEEDRKPCPDCGAEVKHFDFGTECTECDWSTSATIEAPEGGWARGSDMDRI